MSNARSKESASRTEWAERQLRATIVSGELPPGARIRVEELAESWDVSPTPLREAVRTLAGEGLITLRAQRGARVGEVSAAEMEDVYATRMMLEPYVLRLSLERADDAWRVDLDAAWAALERASAAGPEGHLDLEPAHSDFHHALLAACGSPSLLRICGQLQTQSLRFRVLTRSTRPGGFAESRAEHAEMVAAALELDESRAMSLAAVHLGRTVMSTLGVRALETLIDRIRLAQGISTPVLDGLTSLV
jgi:GntR family transcriptional regulator, carbon starvation induced regulator